MEGLENATVTPSVAPQVTPLVTQPAPTAAPSAAMPSSEPSGEPNFSDSSSDNSLMGTLKSLNWLEITFGIIGAAALYYTIYYYNYSLKNSTQAKTEMQNRIDSLEIKLSDVAKTLEENTTLSQPLF